MRVELNEWSITGEGGSSLQSVSSGDVTAEVHNDGIAGDLLAVWRGGRVVRDEVRGGILIAETPFVRPGDTATLDVNLAPGQYVLTCLVPGHIDHGMYSDIAVQANPE